MSWNWPMWKVLVKFFTRSNQVKVLLSSYCHRSWVLISWGYTFYLTVPHYLISLSLFVFSSCLCSSVALISPSAGYLALEIKWPLRVRASSSGCRICYSFGAGSPCLLWSALLSLRPLTHTWLILELNSVKRAYLFITIKLLMALLSYA